MPVSTPPLNQVIATMMGLLDDYLPPPVPPLPNPGVSMVGLKTRTVGLGNSRGTEKRGSIAVVELKGIRLDARVQFQLWATGPAEAETAMTTLNAQLMGARDPLWIAGFLRLKLEAAPPAERLTAVRAWRKQADYSVLYEYRYQDTDGSESLIASIPVESDLERRNVPERETTVVTDEMVRWDNEAAPALVVRGPFSVKRFSAVAFTSGTAPSGTVTLRRTFDGAIGLPTVFPLLADFLAAVVGSNPQSRHAQVTFGTPSSFLNAFSPAGAPITLGDWNRDSLPDSYQARMLAIEPAIRLPGVADRLEIAYQGAALDQVSVIYLRAQ